MSGPGYQEHSTYMLDPGEDFSQVLVSLMTGYFHVKKIHPRSPWTAVLTSRGGSVSRGGLIGVSLPADNTSSSSSCSDGCGQALLGISVLVRSGQRASGKWACGLLAGANQARARREGTAGGKMCPGTPLRCWAGVGVSQDGAQGRNMTVQAQPALMECLIRGEIPGRFGFQSGHQAKGMGWYTQIDPHSTRVTTWNTEVAGAEFKECSGGQWQRCPSHQE